MPKLSFPIGFTLLWLSAAGCSDNGNAPRAENKPRLIPRTEIRKNEKPAVPATGLAGRSADQIVGTGKWDTGKPHPTIKANLEKTALYKGNTTAAGGNSISVNVGGKQMTFETDTNTFIYRAGDPRFFQIEGGVNSIGVGTEVTIEGYGKNGKFYASRIAVGVRQNAGNN